MELALARLATQALGGPAAFDRVDEIPFEPERKRLVTVHRVAGELALFVKGAPEEVVSRAGWVEDAGGREPLTAERAGAFSTAATAMADRGLRVLAFAYRVLPSDYDLADAGSYDLAEAGSYERVLTGISPGANASLMTSGRRDANVEVGVMRRQQ